MKKLAMACIAVVVVLMFGCVNVTTMAQSSYDSTTAQDSAQADTLTPETEEIVTLNPHETSLPIKDTSTEHLEIKHYYQQCEISQASLSQSYPDPCLEDTLYIGYSVPEYDRVVLEIYNLLGQLVDVIIDENQYQGRHEIRLRFLRGTTSSGIYFYKISIGGYTNTKKLIILR